MVSDISKLSLEEIYDSLKTQSYLQVPFPVNRVILEEAVQAFFRFLEEPEAIKTHIDFTIAPNHRRGDIGFKHRNPDDDIYNDSKEFFHFHPAIFERYDCFLKENPVVYDFVKKASPIWEAAYQVVHGIFSKFEEEFPAVVNKIFDTKDVHLLIRFLRYHWTHSGRYLAKPHFDAGSFTLAIAESEPGLRIGKDPESLKLVEHEKDQALFFVSSNYRKVIDTSEIMPGWHDVIQLDETKIGKPYARWAVVAFIEAAGVEALPRTETHKWYTQEVVNE